MLLSISDNCVTGTNGKTTVATLLSHVFNVLGYPAKTAGNIGFPLSELIAEYSDYESHIFWRLVHSSRVCFPALKQSKEFGRISPKITWITDQSKIILNLNYPNEKVQGHDLCGEKCASMGS